MNTNTSAPIGVLLMAYGGPNSLDEIAGYLADIRSGRPTNRAVLDEITHNYAQIGGKSPLMEKTMEQVEAVRAQLDANRYRLYVGMRHWAPWIEEVVGQMVSDGITQAVSMVLAPHYSSMSIAKYQEKIAAGLEMYRGKIEFAHVASYHDAPDYIQALANRVKEGIARWNNNEQADVHVVFSAHSLPTRILKMGDPYQDQLWETARLVAETANLPKERWSWSYQSAGRSPEPWLGPQIEEYVAELAARGIKKVVSIPIGFVSDHVEILFDIDIKAQAVAKKVGVRLERPPALNADPLFIKTLVEQIEKNAERFILDREVDETNYQHPQIRRAFDLIEVDKISPEERFQMYHENHLQEKKNEGFQEGIAKTVRNMLAKGMSSDLVAEVSELSLSEVLQIAASSAGQDS